MAAASPAQQDYLQRLYSLARQDSLNGIVDQTKRVRLRYWTHWAHFCQVLHNGVDPFLSGATNQEKVALLEAFARYVREGNAGRGHQVRSGSVSDAICAIGKTFEMACLPNPTYQPTAYGQHWEPLKNILRSYRRTDPKSRPQLAVPVAVPEHLLTSLSAASPCPLQEATADLANIAFYYLLRVGEYARPRNTKTLTQPFSVMHITFRDSNGNLIPNDSPLSALLLAAEATIRIPDQKNGVKGQCIHVQCTGSKFSPIKSLARRVHHILSNGGTQATPIYYNHYQLFTTWRQVTADHISKAIKQAAGEIGLYRLGYEPADVSSHSLRAGGAMAMHLNKIDTITIRKIGRWKSDTFLMYIHGQIIAFAAGVSLKMSNAIPFRHIAGPTVSTPA